MKQKAVFQSSDLYEAFPRTDEVFSGIEKELLLPIGVVSFKYFDNNHDDKVLLAIPIEPEEDFIGACSREYHTESCRENWLGYLMVDGKWYLDCDKKFFMKEHPKWKDDEDTLAFYESSRSYFNKIKSFYRSNGFLQGNLEKAPNKENMKELISLGGLTPSGQNWDAYEDFPYQMNEEFGEDELTILNTNGDKYTYIGTVSKYRYTDTGDTVHFFYEPKSKKVQLVDDMS